MPSISLRQLILVVIFLQGDLRETQGQTPLPVGLRLTNNAAIDQDDVCFWSHPTDPERCVAIVSDKSANFVFIYDTQGQLIHKVSIAQPGNIDVRSDFPLGGDRLPLIVVNERETNKLVALALNTTDRTVYRVDDGNIVTGENYGSAFGRLPNTDRFFSVVTSKEHGVAQFEIQDSGQGRVRGSELRRWELGMCEGAVVDDESSTIYISVEAEGIFRLPLNPADNTPPVRVIAIGNDAFVGDVEGITILRQADGSRLLIVSDQGASRLRVYQLDAHYPLRAVLAVAEVTETDGVDVTPLPFGHQFPHGALACHSNLDHGKTMRVVDLRLVVENLSRP